MTNHPEHRSPDESLGLREAALERARLWEQAQGHTPSAKRGLGYCDWVDPARNGRVTVICDTGFYLAALAVTRPESDLDVERLAEAFTVVQPNLYGQDWPRDDPDDFQFVNPREHALAIAAAYAALRSTKPG